MANYVISKVRYNKAGTHIDEVVVNNEGALQTRIEQRPAVVANIKARKSYRTAPPGGKATAVVRIITVSGDEYLRTDANNIARDNLESLSTF